MMEKILDFSSIISLNELRDPNKLSFGFFLIKNGFDEEIITKKKYEDFHFKTWNILVCGGEGWELCAGINPIMWNYPTLTVELIKKTAVMAS